MELEIMVTSTKNFSYQDVTLLLTSNIAKFYFLKTYTSHNHNMCYYWHHMKIKTMTNRCCW
jgi:hypothetical protein